MKKLFIALAILLTTTASFSQSNESDAVKAVLQQYKSALENLDGTNAKNLFTTDSKVFESGKNEGTFENYLEHHLAPEFKEFSSFKFSDYKVDVEVAGNYAFATESYNYTIVLAKDKSEIKRKGIATAMLKKVNGEWKIMISHNSSRKG